MLNPLSIQIGQTITGKQINDWCHDQINNNKSHYKDAKRLLSKNYNDKITYYKIYDIGTGCGELGKISFCRIR